MNFHIYISYWISLRWLTKNKWGNWCTKFLTFVGRWSVVDLCCWGYFPSIRYLWSVVYMSLLWAWWIRYFFIIFESFSLFSTMRSHAQVCIGWSKYTTSVQGLELGNQIFSVKSGIHFSLQIFHILYALVYVEK